MKVRSVVLIIGSTGKLGGAIKNSGLFLESVLLTPTKTELNILNEEHLRTYLISNKVDLIIHTAAIARMKMCEEDPATAIDVNVTGTGNVVKAILASEAALRKSIRLIYISTDGVYAGVTGNYDESSSTLPYNFYGHTKLAAEATVHCLKDFVIIRTRFFDPNDIAFASSPIDIFTSKVTLSYLVKAIYFLVGSDWRGVINVGEGRSSEFEINKKFKPEITACLRKDILLQSGVSLATDASMNTTRWEELKKRNNWIIND
jgi:hypothetical protein